MPIRQSLFGGVRGAPSAARWGWASADPLERASEARSAARREGVSDGSRRGETPSAARCAARQRGPGIAGGRTEAPHDCTDALGFVELEIRLCPNLRIRRTASAHFREATEPQSRRSGFAPMHGDGCAAPQKSVQNSSRPRAPLARRGAHFLGVGNSNARGTPAARAAPIQSRGPGRSRGLTLTRPRARLRALRTRRRSKPSPRPRLPLLSERRRRAHPAC